MKIRTFAVALAVALLGSLIAAQPASASSGCNNGTIPVLYKKLTGKELIHCPW